MLELPSFLQLSDYLVRLLEARNKQTKSYFETIVRPSFESAQLVRDDLVAILEAARTQAESGATAQELARSIAQARPRFKGSRDKLRGLLSNVPKEELTRFEKAILAMIGGELNHTLRYLENEIEMAAIQIEVNYRRSGTSHSKPMREAITEKILPLLRQATESVELAWKEAADGYGEYALNYTRHQ